MDETIVVEKRESETTSDEDGVHTTETVEIRATEPVIPDVTTDEPSFIETLSAKIAYLEGRLDALENRPAPAAPAPTPEPAPAPAAPAPAPAQSPTTDQPATVGAPAQAPVDIPQSSDVGQSAPAKAETVVKETEAIRASKPKKKGAGFIW